MKTSQNDKCSDKSKKTGEVRMGHEVSSEKTSCCGSEKDDKCSDKKEKTREDMASSKV